MRFGEALRRRTFITSAVVLPEPLRPMVTEEPGCQMTAASSRL